MRRTLFYIDKLDDTLGGRGCEWSGWRRDNNDWCGDSWRGRGRGRFDVGYWGRVTAACGDCFGDVTARVGVSTAGGARCEGYVFFPGWTGCCEC